MIFLHLHTFGGRKLRRMSGSFLAQLGACCEFSVFQEAIRAMPKDWKLEKGVVERLFTLYL
jgi:hypothetical protein